MITKVCGLINSENAAEVSELGVDLLGINFYKDSSRYIGDKVLEDIFTPIVGVFVNSSYDHILDMIDKHNLSYVQLHGDETPEFASMLNEEIPVIKAIGVETRLDMDIAAEYTDVEYLLFDKKSKFYGGSGNKFNWDLIKEYKGEVPFIIAGGIGPEDFDVINNFTHELFEGIDINSRFEVSPGIKNVVTILDFLGKVK